MEKLYHIIIIILCLPFFSLCRGNLQKFRPKSWQTFAYLVSAIEADQFAISDSIPINRFVDRMPTMIFNADSIDEEKLSIGNYVLLTANDIYVTAKFICISDLIVLDVNNKNKLQLDIRNKAGEFMPGAKVFVNNNNAVYNNDSKTFWVK
ncbi:MAG: hypothetical protein ABI863_08700 [Ginsengibacter sp.]